MNRTGARVRDERRLLPMISVLAVIVGIASLQAATQMFAHIFGYQEVLGTNAGHMYAPWEIVRWRAYYTDYPDEYMRSVSVGMVVGSIGLLLLYWLRAANSDAAKAYEFLHGSAQWAGRRDIERAGLLPRRRTLLDILSRRRPKEAAGVYVGGWKDNRGRLHYLRHDGPENVLTYAPTRSGKGVSLVIPTLLSWPASCVITDLKGELWSLTAGWRREHADNKVIRFEPANEAGSARWNPLDEIRVGTGYEVGDVQNLATLIVDPDGKGLESHWQKTAQALLVGVILHVLYLRRAGEGEASLPAVDTMLADPSRPIKKLWLEMQEYQHLDSGTHPVVASAAQDMLDRPAEEAGSVLSTAKSYLALYRDPVVAANVKCSDFCVRDLMHYEKPVSLYLVSSPTDKTRLRPLMRVMINTIVRVLADRMEFEQGRAVKGYKHRLLAMMDEFPSLGRLDIVQESLAFLAGYGVKCYLICQDINQLKSRESGYGQDESITSNCHVQNAFPPNRIETAEHLSRVAGQTTVVKENITVSGGRGAFSKSQVSKSFQEVARPLLTPDEAMRLPGPKKNGGDQIEEGGEMIIYVAGFPAIRGTQPLYFKDPIFAERARVNAPRESDRIRVTVGATPASSTTPDGEG